MFPNVHFYLVSAFIYSFMDLQFKSCFKILLSLFLWCADPDKIKLVPARNLLIPFGRPITFKCFCDPSAVISSNVIFGWTVHFTNGASHYSHSRRKKLILLDMGIDIFDTNKTVSTLQFNGTDENVQSVECQFYDHDVGILHVSDVANITMFGMF